jgi:OPA family glycerol-3-phosphate transporter-like MFS transporter
MELHQISGNKMGRVFILLLSVICIFGIIDNIIRDGLTTWTPSIFKEIYSMPDSYSILLTLGLPLLSVLGSTLCLAVHKKIKDHVKLCALFFLFAIVFLSIMVLCMPLDSWIITLICFAVSALLMSAINNCITSIVPLELRDMADSGAIAGVTNTFCYMGSTISTYALGVIADSAGWNGAFNFLIILCMVALAICAIYLPLHHWFALDKKRKM